MVPIFNWVADWFKRISDVRPIECASYQTSSARSSQTTDSDSTSKVKTQVTFNRHRSKPKHFSLHRSLSCSHLNKRARYGRQRQTKCRLSPRHAEQLRGLVQGNARPDDVDNMMLTLPGYGNEKAACHGRLQVTLNSMKDQIVPKFSEALKDAKVRQDLTKHDPAKEQVIVDVTDLLVAQDRHKTTSEIDCESTLFPYNEQPTFFPKSIPVEAKFALSNDDEDRISIEVCDEFLKSQGFQVEDEVLERAEISVIDHMHEDFAELSSEDVTHALSVL